MTITELRQDLEKLEAMGRGLDLIGFKSNDPEGYWDISTPAVIEIHDKWIPVNEGGTLLRTLTSTHYLEIEKL